MKSILKILVLGAVLILGTTAVVDQGLAADKGSQLIFQSNMAHHNFISITNTDSTQAVTVLFQYYNNDMERAVWYLRVILGGTTVLVDPFNHMIPGSDPATNIGNAIMGSGKAGNGHFVIAVTAVGAVTVDDDGTTTVDEGPAAGTDVVGRANILFPEFLAGEMDGTDNIDACGTLVTVAADDSAADRNPIMHMQDDTEDNRCKDADDSSKNVGNLSVLTAQPVVFNHLTGHFTEALVGTDAGGNDQTASWGGTPVVRPGVDDTNNAMAGVRDYQVLTGANAATNAGGRLAEKDAGGMEVDVHDPDGDGTGHNVPAGTDTEDGFSANGDNKILPGERNIRGIGGTTAGALVLPALHGGADETKQIMLLLSVADNFGGAGNYELLAARTGYMVTPMDPMGNPLDMEAAGEDPVFGGGAKPEDKAVPSAAIIVDGINVETNADLGKCSGTPIDGPWTLAHLTDLIPEATEGGKDFAGLGAMLDPMMNASPGWVKFARSNLVCKKDYGDKEDSHNLTAIEPADGVPVTDERIYTGGTLIVEELSQNRAFVTTGRALLKFITSDSTFAASWTLKSPASGTADDGDVSQ